MIDKALSPWQEIEDKESSFTIERIGISNPKIKAQIRIIDGEYQLFLQGLILTVGAPWIFGTQSFEVIKNNLDQILIDSGYVFLNESQMEKWNYIKTLA